MHWFYDPEITDGSERITKAELEHFKSLRITSGEEITITSGNGSAFVAKVINSTSGEIEVLGKLPSAPRPRVHLAQAIAKGGRDESALQACVELGVASVTAFEADRSIANWRGKEAKNLSRWQQIAVSAIKQSQQQHLPEINYVPSTGKLKPIGLGLVLDPRATESICQVAFAKEYTIVVGPEGGFSDHELQQLQAAGFRSVRLGSSVLRTSTAGVVATACLQLIAGDFIGA